MVRVRKHPCVAPVESPLSTPARRKSWLSLGAAALLLASACVQPPVERVATALPVPAVGEARSPRQAAIVEPRAAPGVFPRTVHDSTGDVVIPARPRRIHTLSVGYDEITFRLVDLSRIVAIGSVTANPLYSNVSTEAAQIPARVGRDAEQILAQAPDLVVASPFVNPDLVTQLRNANATVVVADLVSSVDAQADNIRFLAYIYGEEARGEALVSEVSDRIASLKRVTDRHPVESRPRVVVLSIAQNITAAGSGTTEDGVLQLAGARNAAAEAGVNGNLVMSMETLANVDPDYIVLAEPDPDHSTLLPRLREQPVAASLTALRDNRVLLVKSSLLSTLSQWNVAGAEQLNRLLYPGELP